MALIRKEALKIAGIYMMINIGAGFTSGQEILQFFSAYGWFSILSAIITFSIMFYAGESLLDAGWICRDNKQISVFEYFGGKYLGMIYNIIIPILLYGSYIIMVAGAGALVEQYFKIPNVIGRFIVCLLSVVSVFTEFNRTAKYLGYLGKAVASIILLLSVIIIFKNLNNIMNISDFINSVSIKKGSDTAYGAGILYGGMITLASCQFLFDTGKNSEYRLSCRSGALYGTTGFVGIILMINLAILLNLTKVYNLPIVTLYFAEQISSVLALCVTILIFIAMYSASTVSLWSVVNIVKKKFEFWRKRYVMFVVLLGVGGLILSAFPFGVLVNFIYPINGVFGIILILLMMFHHRNEVYRINNKDS